MRYIDETPCSFLVQELRFLIKFLSRRLGFKSRRLGNRVPVTPSSISWKSRRLDIPSSRFFSRPSAVNRELKKLRRQLQGKRLIKTELCVMLSLLRLFHVDHIVQNRRVLFRLLATNGFRVKAKEERFTAASSRCRQNLKYENFPSPFGRLRQNNARKSVPHVQHDYFSSFNQSNH